MTVRTLQGGKFVEGSNNNRHTNFANIMILAPSSDTYEVEVTPKNEKGAGLSEKTIIPAVRDEPRKNYTAIFSQSDKFSIFIHASLHRGKSILSGAINISQYEKNRIFWKGNFSVSRIY